MTRPPGRRRSRLLDEEERRLWDLVAASVEPLFDRRHRRPAHAVDPDPPAPLMPPPPSVVPVTTPPEPVPKPRPSKRIRLGATAVAADHLAAPRPRTIHVKHSLVPEPVPHPGIDDRTRRRLARGALPIDARLDLHGLTQAAAHSALRHFLVTARARGARLVLVITGKGGGDVRLDGSERGILRRSVPHWLADASLREVVLGFEEAHLAHGGAGAIYVRLRRPPGGEGPR